jgi:molybdopterin synthase catalytic subunit
MDVDSRVELLRSALPLQELGAWPALPATGALVSFAGLTRTPGLRGRAVERLEFEVYEPMARRVLLRLCREAQARAGGALARVLVAHRVGAVPVGEASLLVCVSSPHRAEALAAVPWLVDMIKAHAPVWKKEVYADGGGEWVAGCVAGGGGGHAAGGSGGHAGACAREAGGAEHGVGGGR